MSRIAYPVAEAKAYAKLTVSTTAVAFVVPAGANSVVFVVEGDKVRYKFKGSTDAPTSTDGIQMQVGDGERWESVDWLSTVRFIRSGAADATVHAQFYRLSAAGDTN